MSALISDRLNIFPQKYTNICMKISYILGRFYKVVNIYSLARVGAGE